jgi:DNA-binding winged helix-turn-helix (wHTH) protein
VAIDICILGPIEVSSDRVLALATMQRRLLAALATRAGETCSADVLIDALWGPLLGFVSQPAR